LLGIGIIFSLGINATAAAQTAKGAVLTSNIYVNGSSGNDNWDGLNSTYISGINGPKATIKNATGTVTTDGTIYIANGQYTGTNNTGITINHNMTIIGENQQNTIINAQENGDIFNIPAGVNVTLINLSLINGKVADETGGGAIYNNGTLNLINCTFTNNHAGFGGAINNWGGTLNVNNSTFNNNSASDRGGAIYFPSLGGTINVTNSTFTHNYGGYGGGAILCGGILNISYSTFTYNSITYNWGGAIWNNEGTCNVNFNRIVGNTAPGWGSAIFNYGTMDATNNWWGSNIDPKSIPNLIVSNSGNVNTNTWVILTVNATPKTINNSQTSTVTADLLHDNEGSLISGHIPDGITVNFTSDELGTVNPKTNITKDRSTNTTFTDIFSGVSKVSATVDNQTVTTNITINKIPTTISAQFVNGYNGKTVNLTSTLRDIRIFAYRTFTFYGLPFQAILLMPYLSLLISNSHSFFRQYGQSIVLGLGIDQP
jgi:predicted outer membrane repeat protein